MPLVLGAFIGAIAGAKVATCTTVAVTTATKVKCGLAVSKISADLYALYELLYRS